MKKKRDEKNNSKGDLNYFENNLKVCCKASLAVHCGEALFLRKFRTFVYLNFL